MVRNLFTYGTLMSEDVMRSLTGKQFPCSPGLLHDYARFAFKHKIYPGIVPAAGSMVAGKIYKDLDNESMCMLDWFEDDRYVRTKVRVQYGKTNIKAWAYVVSGDHRGLLDQIDWNYTLFLKRDLSAYSARCSEYAKQWHDKQFKG